MAARAPGKVILFGEHAVNRGQPALSAGVGLRATCRLRRTEGTGGVLESGAPGHEREQTSREAILALARAVDGYRATGELESIRALAQRDFFAPQKYVLATALGHALPPGLTVSFASEIPRSGGSGRAGPPSRPWPRPWGR